MFQRNKQIKSKTKKTEKNELFCIFSVRHPDHKYIKTHSIRIFCLLHVLCLFIIYIWAYNKFERCILQTNVKMKMKKYYMKNVSYKLIDTFYLFIYWNFQLHVHWHDDKMRHKHTHRGQHKGKNHNVSKLIALSSRWDPEHQLDGWNLVPVWNREYQLKQITR